MDAGADTTFALGSVSQDAIGFSFAPTNTDRSWLTIVGNDLTVLSAPDVTTDTDYSVIVRATRSGINVDKTLTVRVVGTGATPVALDFGSETISDRSMGSRNGREFDSTDRYRRNGDDYLLAIAYPPCWRDLYSPEHVSWLERRQVGLHQRRSLTQLRMQTAPLLTKRLRLS